MFSRAAIFVCVVVFSVVKSQDTTVFSICFRPEAAMFVFCCVFGGYVFGDGGGLSIYCAFRFVFYRTTYEQRSRRAATKKSVGGRVLCHAPRSSTRGFRFFIHVGIITTSWQPGRARGPRHQDPWIFLWGFSVPRDSQREGLFGFRWKQWGCLWLTLNVSWYGVYATNFCLDISSRFTWRSWHCTELYDYIFWGKSQHGGLLDIFSCIEYTRAVTTAEDFVGRDWYYCTLHVFRGKDLNVLIRNGWDLCAFRMLISIGQ